MKRSILIFVVSALAAAPAWAASDSREKQLLRRMQQQVQQVDRARAQAEQEKATALADKENAERELEKLRLSNRQLAGERAARRRLERERQAVQVEMETLKTKLADTEKQLADSVALQRATAQTLAQTESARKRTEGELKGTSQALQVCQAHNGKLYGMGREMMQKYRDKSCQDALAQAEPFTGLKKVEVENLLERWRDRLDREKLGTSGEP
jgi:chromosome segregation ATPase